MKAFTPKNITDLKIVFAGDAGVGKTALIRRIKGCEFDKRYISTIGSELHPIFMKPSALYSYVFWDIAGQEKYAGSYNSYLKDAKSIVLMYDVTSKTSYMNIKKWYTLAKSSNPDESIVIVGNKCDSTNQKLHTNELTFHMENGLQYFEISAKTGENIDTLLEYIIYTCK